MKGHVIVYHIPQMGWPKNISVPHKSLYFPRKAVIVCNEKSIDYVTFNRSALKVAQDMVTKADPQFYLGSIEVPEELIEDIISAAKTTKRKGKNLVSLLKKKMPDSLPSRVLSDD